MHFVITGSTGYLGTNLLKKFQKADYLHLIVRDKKKAYTLLEGLNIKNINLYYFNEIAILKKNLRKNKIFFVHLATNYGRNNESFFEILKANTITPLRLIFYFKKNISFFLNMDTTLNPLVNRYSFTKFIFKKTISILPSLKTVNVRFDFMYGPKNYSSFIFNFINDCMKNDEIHLTDGSQIRNFIFIDDLISAIFFIINHVSSNKINKNISFDIGSDKCRLKLRTFLNEVKNQVKSTSILKFGYLPRRKFEIDNPKLNFKNINLLGWYPKYHFKLGIKKIIN